MAISKQIKKNDVGNQLSFTLTDQDNTPINLTGATVKVIIAGGYTYTKLERTCVVDSAVAGTCHYILTATDTSIPGDYSIEVNIDYGGSEFTTVTQGDLRITDTL